MSVEIISLAIAFAAVIIGPIVSYQITKKNLEFQFRTVIKEKWVDKLAEASHLFLSSVLEWIEKYRGIKDGSSKVENPHREIDRMFDNINSSIIRLQLLLDDEKEDQKFILNSIVQIKSIVNDRTFDTQSIANLKERHQAMIEKLTKLFHQERSKMANTFRSKNQEIIKWKK